MIGLSVTSNPLAHRDWGLFVQMTVTCKVTVISFAQIHHMSLGFIASLFRNCMTTTKLERLCTFVHRIGLVIHR